jgi:hypothetical protein
MAGLVMLQEMHDLTDMQVLYSLRFDFRFQAALHLFDLCDDELYISLRSYVSFKNRLISHGFAGDFFSGVTKGLIDKFNVPIEFQRLDSVHLESNMKKAGRLGIMSATVKKFLSALKRKEPEAFGAVSQEMIGRYKLGERSGYDCFGRCPPSQRGALLETVAKDLHCLAEQFAGHPAVSEMAEFKLVARVLGEQCVVVGGCRLREAEDRGPYTGPELDEALIGGDEDEPVPEVRLKDPKDVSSESLQYPTDPDASFDGHKGKGYQAQIVETYIPSRDPEEKSAGLSMLVYVEVEGAANSDSAALAPAVDKLVEENLKPKQLAADTSFGSNKNCAHAAANGIKLVAPVPGQEGAPKRGKDGSGRGEAAEVARADSFAREAEYSLECAEDGLEPPEESPSEPFRLSDFESGEDGAIVRCPMGQVPLEGERGDGGAKIYFGHDACSACARKGDCPVTITKKLAWLTCKPEEVISSKRRAWEKTVEFIFKYCWRSGIEATNSHLARLGLKRVRVRGLGRVSLVVKLKALGLNIWRLAAFLWRNQEASAMI